MAPLNVGHVKVSGFTPDRELASVCARFRSGHEAVYGSKLRGTWTDGV